MDTYCTSISFTNVRFSKGVIGCAIARVRVTNHRHDTTVVTVPVRETTTPTNVQIMRLAVAAGPTVSEFGTRSDGKSKMKLALFALTSTVMGTIVNMAFYINDPTQVLNLFAAIICAIYVIMNINTLTKYQ
jgi:hypothetical protein